MERELTRLMPTLGQLINDNSRRINEVGLPSDSYLVQASTYRNQYVSFAVGFTHNNLYMKLMKFFQIPQSRHLKLEQMVKKVNKMDGKLQP